MSILTLDETKEFLRITHTAHDSLLNSLIRQASTFVENYTDANVDNLSSSSSSEPVTESLKTAALLTVQALFEGKSTDIEILLKAAERFSFPDRCNIGV